MLTLFSLKYRISPSKTAGFYSMTNRLSVMGSLSKNYYLMVAHHDNYNGAIYALNPGTTFLNPIANSIPTKVP
jgi:hypothetical protein